MHTDGDITRRTVAHEWPLPRKAAHAIEPLIKAALDAGRDKRPGRRQRVDGWTPERIRMFLEILAERGNVTDAARAAGKTARSAYLLRDGDSSHAFAAAWRAAVALARARPAGAIVPNLGGRVAKPIIRNGQLWGWRLRHDNRRDMAALTRLDAQARKEHWDAPATVACDFEDFVDLICDGGAAAEEMGN